MTSRLYCDVLVIGGGMAGCATAFHLCEGGADVVLAERVNLNAQGSSSNVGSLHAQIPHEQFVRRGEGWARAYAPVTGFLRESISLWRVLPELLDADLEVRITGGLLVAATGAQMQEIRRKSRIEGECGLSVELVSREDLRGIAPYISEQMVGGELCAAEGMASPVAAGAAYARAAQRLGARLMQDTDIVSIKRDNDRFLATSARASISARRVVSCAGADAGRITGFLGVDLPIVGLPIQACITRPVADRVQHLVYFAGDKLTLKQPASGSLLVGGGWPALRGADGRPKVSSESLHANLRVAERVVPAIGRTRPLRAWAGYVNATEDWLPIVGEVPSVPGLYVGAFPYMGFTAAPLLGVVLANLVLGRRDHEHELSPFGLHRF